jgi:predicted TIM-barrel fold metal-dependent hydrolase
MVIDAHVHLVRPFDSRGRRQLYTPNPASAEDYVATMDAAGIDRAFFISWSPADIPSDLAGKGIAPEDVRETLSREYALEALAAHRDRFHWFPCHLGPRVADHVALARDALRMGAAGLKLVLSFWGELPDDPRPMKLCGLAEEHGAQVIIDTSFWYLGKEPPIDPDTLPAGHRKVARRVEDFSDYLRHLAVPIERYPRVSFSLAHAGARMFTAEHALDVGDFIRRYPNVYADLGALDTSLPALDCLVEAAGADRVMFGTDWPHFAQGPAMDALIAAIRRPGRFAPRVAEAILGENALAFVKGRAPGLRA